MQILSHGKLVTRCVGCGCKFRYQLGDCFQRGVPTHWDLYKGGFHRETHVYVRCPECKRRIDVSGKVPVDAVGSDDPICKCEGRYCHCE